VSRLRAHACCIFLAGCSPAEKPNPRPTPLSAPVVAASAPAQEIAPATSELASDGGGAPLSAAALPLAFDEAWDFVNGAAAADRKPVPPEVRAECTPSEVPALCILRKQPQGARTVSFAEELWRKHHVAVGQLPPEWMDGGYRGKIELKPQFAEASDARQLPWILAAMNAQRTFRDALTAKLGLAPRPFSGLPNRLRFFVSVGRTTPAAMAIAIAATDQFYWNLHGSLHRDAKSVTETVIHEAFHLEDDHHNGWSLRALTATHAKILAQCSGKNAAARDSCLAPYAPGRTRVRGGTFYAFHGGNDTREYGAELAVRFFEEALAAPPNPWKCATAENSYAWGAFVTEFWSGKDPLPACLISSSGVPAP
jgi:hypothetical protein